MGSKRFRGIYLILEEEHFTPSQRKKIEQALKERVLALLQFRAKELSDRQFLKRAKDVQEFLGGRVPFIVNDRLDAALLLNADGLHLGGEDLPLEEARRLFKKLLGYSAHTAADIRKGSLFADYLGLGPIFLTTTKKRAKKPLGLKKALALASLSSKPVIPIGGLQPQHFPLLEASGISCMACCRSFFELPWKEFQKRLFLPPPPRP